MWLKNTYFPNLKNLDSALQLRAIRQAKQIIEIIKNNKEIIDQAVNHAKSLFVQHMNSLSLEKEALTDSNNKNSISSKDCSVQAIVSLMLTKGFLWVRD